MKGQLLSAGFLLMAASAQAGFNVTGFGPGSWGTSDATLGVAGYVIEDFEDVNMASGLLVGVTSTNGSYGPSSTIPNTFNPFVDNTFGTAFQFGGGGAWDGTKGLINTRTNREFSYSEVGSWGVTTFVFSGGATSVGFSMQQMDQSSNLIINGNQIGLLDVLAGWTTNGLRQGYVRIDAFGGDQINSITIQNGTTSFNDGLMFDHLAFNPVPEPGTMAFLALFGAVAARRRKC